MKNHLKLVALCSALLLTSTVFGNDKLDTELQGNINSLYSQFRDSPAFSAVQLSVLLPDEAQPRDYVVGTQSVENHSISATTTMLTQYGSITKEFTSALIIKYIDSHPHSISLQTTLKELFPKKFKSHAWPAMWEMVTIEQLMNMTSGIPNYTDSLHLSPYPHYT